MNAAEIMKSNLGIESFHINLISYLYQVRYICVNNFFSTLLHLYLFLYLYLHLYLYLYLYLYSYFFLYLCLK